MKIFYTASLDVARNSADKEWLRVISEVIPDLLTSYTNGRLVTYLVDDTVKHHELVPDVLADIRSSDAFVGEMSAQSQALGFELAYANLHFVPSLYLYRPKILKTAPDRLFTDNPTRKLWVRGYEEEDIGHIVKSFIRMVERQMETARTSFMSTKEIDAFIAEESDAKGVAKGEIIRQVLSEAAKRGEKT